MVFYISFPQYRPQKGGWLSGQKVHSVEVGRPTSVARSNHDSGEEKLMTPLRAWITFSYRPQGHIGHQCHSKFSMRRPDQNESPSVLETCYIRTESLPDCRSAGQT